MLLFVALSAVVRGCAALRDPRFDTRSPDGLLKSDPALLYYLTERILAAGGGVPADFRADPRIQHPSLTDAAAEFTVGQEFLLAWTARLVGGETPLHVVAVGLASALASLALLGAWLLARERTRAPGLALLAVALAATVTANYRTIGFVLVREDLSFPLFALHLGLLARAARVRSARAFLLAGAALGAALATWHALRFFALLEVAVAVAAYARTGRSPFAARGAWALLVGPVLAGALVPAMAASGLLVSLPFALVLGLVLLGTVPRLAAAGRPAGLSLLATLAAALLFAGRLGRADAYGHVTDVLLAKLRFLGRMPDDPTVLPFDARLLWQGPFETLGFERGWYDLGIALLLFLVAVVGAPRARAPLDRALEDLTWVSLPVAWLIARTTILPGLLLPVASVVALARWRRRRLALGLASAALVLQALSFLNFARAFESSWYLPPGRQTEIATLLGWLRTHVDPSEPIVADFVNSTAILAGTGNPICLQPKYETETSRRNAQAFLETFFHGTPEELRQLVRERFDARLLLVDRYTLWWLSRTTAGLPASAAAPLPGTAAERFLSQDPAVLESVEGFELLYRSPADIRQQNGAPYDFFRLYRVR